MTPTLLVALALSGPGLAPETEDAFEGTATAAEVEPDDVFEGAGPSPAAEPLPVPASPPEPPPPRLRASPTEGFGIDSGDGRHGISLGTLFKFRFSVLDLDGQPTTQFALPLARLMVQGHLWGDRLQWQLQPEFAGGARLLDANATINLHPAFSILVGQYRPWFTRGFPTNLPVQALFDRGVVLDAFRYDRDLGVTLMGRPFEGRLEYYLGVLDGEGVSPEGPRNAQPLLTARVVGAPLGEVGYSNTTAANAERDLPFRFAVGLGAATNEITPLGTTTDPITGTTTTTILPDRRTVVGGGDLVLQGWRVQAQAEGFYRRNWDQGGLTSEAWGTYGQISGVLVRQRLELVMRSGALRQEVDTQAGIPIEPGINVYVFGDHAKLQARYLCLMGADSGACGTHRVGVQAQLWF